MDVSKTIFAENWVLVEYLERVHLYNNYGVEIVLSPEDAHDVWQVLNKWIERNAPNVEEEK